MRTLSDLLDEVIALHALTPAHREAIAGCASNRVFERDATLLRDVLDSSFESEHHRKFRINRSLRDVEPNVSLFLKDLSGLDVDDDA